ncbi:hypothetical protein N7520_003551 [Penicillium odoratum]|uniref:uncharacterized protein n=1 Tax=Penicillium odoratum TaxID=1167516 RepID=UPI0025465DB3|nr:uncharacterized protein N7520_003551 [Penicillium odoratum]KAJ5768992.1 hypothetical protein N7520_003551 [Penicillium odoratum]
MSYSTTTNYVSSLSSWKSYVKTVYAEETTIQGNIEVKTRALPLTFTYNSNFICTQDSSSNYYGKEATIFARIQQYASPIVMTIAQSRLSVQIRILILTLFKQTAQQRTVYYFSLHPIYRDGNGYYYHRYNDDRFLHNGYSNLYNISTGDTRVITRDYTYHFTKATCFPLLCELDTLAERYSNSTYTMSTISTPISRAVIQELHQGSTRPKKSAPRGTYPKPNATITAPSATGQATYYIVATTAYPTQSRTIEECGNYYLVVASDDCSTINLRFGLNFSQLQKYNTYLKSTCGNLWLNYDICVAPVTPKTVSTDGTCPAGVTYVRSAFSDCYSPFGYYGTGSDYCVSTTNGTATSDGTCGPDYGGTTCIPQFGNFCSIYGYCGNSTTYYGAGNCYSSDYATNNGGPSTNREYGPNFAGNKTYTGTQFGTCCSISSYYRSTSDYYSRLNYYSGTYT